METLIHGGDIYSAQPINGRLYDFSANINPLGIPQSVVKAMVGSMKNCIHYPDPLCRDLTAALAEREQVNPAWICCGNGAADLIYRLVYGLRPKKAMVLAPTFAEYELALEAADCQAVKHLLHQEQDFQPGKALLTSVEEEKPDLLFLCNPNNPTGQVLEREYLHDVLTLCRRQGTILVLDECFNDFLDEPEQYTMVPTLGQWDNLVILKAFTKMYAIPGIRIGYCLSANEGINQAIQRAGQAWSVSLPAQSAGTAAATDTDWPKFTRAYVAAQRERLTTALRDAGFRVWKPHANYIFFHVPIEMGLDLKESMAERGIMVRNCGNYTGLSQQYYRIAVKSEEENTFFIKTLREITAEQG